MSSDIRKLVLQIKRNGYDVIPSGSGHLKVVDPNTGQMVASMPSSPSDHRALLNTRAELRKAGALRPLLIRRRVEEAKAPMIEAVTLPHVPFVPKPVPIVSEPAWTNWEIPPKSEDPAPTGSLTFGNPRYGGSAKNRAAMLRNDRKMIAFECDNALADRLDARVKKDGATKRILISTAIEEMLDALDALDLLPEGFDLDAFDTALNMAGFGLDAFDTALNMDAKATWARIAEQHKERGA
jgi:hypothetical protein